MEATDLRRGMRFKEPNESVSVRNRDNWKWGSPEVIINAIRRHKEDPNLSTIYYKDTGGNRYKTTACDFLGRYGEFYKESKNANMPTEHFLTAEELKEYALIKKELEGPFQDKIGDEMKNKKAEISGNQLSTAEKLIDLFKEEGLGKLVELMEPFSSTDIILSFSNSSGAIDYYAIHEDGSYTADVSLDTYFGDEVEPIEEEALIDYQVPIVSKKAQNDAPFGDSDIDMLFENELEFEQFDQGFAQLSEAEIFRLEELQNKKERKQINQEEFHELNTLLEKLEQSTKVGKKAQQMPQEVTFQGIRFQPTPSPFAGKWDLSPINSESTQMWDLWMKETGEVFKGKDEYLGKIDASKKAQIAHLYKFENEVRDFEEALDIEPADLPHMTLQELIDYVAKLHDAFPSSDELLGE